MTISISIPLADLIIEPEQDIDLTALPEQEATKLVKKAFGFLSPSVEVSISSGIVTITAPSSIPQQRDEAHRLLSRGLKSAQQGKYEQAIRLFEESLNLAPDSADTRRNLGMAYLESGQTERAKRLIAEVLRLDPKDVWSYLLLGNIIWKQEHDFDKTTRLYERALKLNPNDPYLLNNYAALLSEREHYDEAETLLRRAIADQPDYPNPYVALAMACLKQDKAKAAAEAIDEMFRAPRSQDIRSEPVYEEARNLYLEANKRIAEQDYDALMAFAEERRAEIEAETGYAIKLVEDNTLKLPAVSQTAWNHDRDYHLIEYRSESRAVVPHLLVRSLEHIAREHEVRQAGRARRFVTTPATHAYAMKFMDDYIDDLRRMGLAQDAIDRSVEQLIQGLALQLFNSVLDMAVEYRVFERYPNVRASQFVWLHSAYRQAVSAVTDSSMKQLFPRKIYNANVAMNAAFAMFIDSLYDGKTNYASAYKTSSQYITAQRLFKLWQDSISVYEPGDEYVLVDEFARELKLQEWYEWQTDLSAVLDMKDRPQGTTNPELLKSKEMATVMYCLGALERFEGMPLDDVREIALEIGMVGIDGIDYASSEAKYTLRSLPGERFTGLHMLAMMYVGFKKIDPQLNASIDLKDAYETALTMYQSKSNKPT
jgi:Tfp pilus assembly protein PilF